MEFNPSNEWELNKKYVGNYTELPGGCIMSYASLPMKYVYQDV